MKLAQRFTPLLTILLVGNLVSTAQVARTVTGTVTDNTGKPVPAVSVSVKGSSQATLTNDEGKYSINISKSDAVLVFSSVGFAQKEVAIGSANSQDIMLEIAAGDLEGVVVTALGVEKQKRQLGYSITNVKGADLSKTNEINPINALQGRVAGVQIDQGAGGLMGNSKILIRGNSTLGTNNQPIFVIDGVIMDNDVFDGSGRDFGNDLKNLNMEDFESVSVLKGSAAAALYGTRAINGVILITTKKGKARKGIGVTLNQTVNVQSPYAGPDFQNEFGGGTVGDFFTDARDPNYKPTERWTTKVFPTDPVTGRPYIDRGIGRELENWGPRMLGQEVINYDGTVTRYLPQPDNFLDAFETGLGSNTNVALDGGNEQSTFRLSYNHNTGKGVVAKNKFNKDAFELRVTHKFTRYLSIDVSGAYSNFNGKNPPKLGGDDAFASNNFGKLYSWMMPRNYDTKYWMQKSKYTSVLGGAPNPGNADEPNKAPESRFWFTLFENDYLQREELFRGRVALTMDITSWLKLVLEGNVNSINTKEETKELGQGINFSGGKYGLGYRNKKSSLMKWVLMANRDISKDLTLSGYIGGEAQRYKNEWEYSETRGGMNYPGSYTIANSVDQPYTEGGIRSRKNFNSLYASADLGYKNMLFMQATWRGDWSSALAYSDGSGNVAYSYPAVSLSWIFTESFRKSLPSWISYGKLRTNFAFLGGDTEPYRINPGFGFNGFNRAGGQTIATSTHLLIDDKVTVIQNNLKPLSKFSKEIGAELRFLNNRLGIDVSFYQDNTKNQILRLPVPIVSGVEDQIINAGEIRNRGVEIALDATPVKTKSFTWSTALNYSHNKNMILKLYPGRTEYNLGANIGEISTWAIEGKSYGTLRTMIHSEAFQAKDVNGNNIDDPRNGLPILAWRSDARTAFPARSNRIQDVGDINAKFRAGWDNTFTYKNFSLNVLVDAKVGGDFVMLSYRYGTHTGVFPNSLAGRDARNGGISWTSQYANDRGTYDDGMIPDGVFAAGQMVETPSGAMVNVGGMTFREAYEKGFVEPSHTPQFFYRYGSSSTGVSDYWVLENSWVSLRQVALNYAFPSSFYSKLKLNGLSLAVIGRDLFYIHQTLPYNFNPASNNSNNTAYSGEEGFLPKMRSFAFTLRASF